jgi:hypothetical protein
MVKYVFLHILQTLQTLLAAILLTQSKIVKWFWKKEIISIGNLRQESERKNLLHTPAVI